MIMSLITYTVIATSALCLLLLPIIGAQILDDFTADIKDQNNLGLLSIGDGLRDYFNKAELVPDGALVTGHCRWIEQLAVPESPMNITNKALLIKYTRSEVHEPASISVTIERTVKGHLTVKDIVYQDLPHIRGEVIIPFVNGRYRNEDFENAESLTIGSRNDNILVRLEHLEFIDYIGAGTDQLLSVDSYIAGKQARDSRRDVYYLIDDIKNLGKADVRGTIIALNSIFGQGYNLIMAMDVSNLNPIFDVILTGKQEFISPDPTATFFSRLSHMIFDPLNGFFVYSNNGQQLLVNPAGKDTTFFRNLMGFTCFTNENPQVYRFIGRVMGLALNYDHVLDCDLSTAVYQMILNKKVLLSDVAKIDSVFHRQLEDILAYNFDKPDEARRILVFTKNGRSTSVTNSNKNEYVQHLIQQKYVVPVQNQINELRYGICEVFPLDKMNELGALGLQKIISGQSTIDAEEWKKWSYYEKLGYSKRDKEVDWFWQTVAKLDDAMLKKLFQVVFGTSRLPFGGFKGLLPHTFTLRKADTIEGVDMDVQLPYIKFVDPRKSAHYQFSEYLTYETKYNLCLPPYSTPEIMDNQVRTFINRLK